MALDLINHDSIASRTAGIYATKAYCAHGCKMAQWWRTQPKDKRDGVNHGYCDLLSYSVTFLVNLATTIATSGDGTSSVGTETGDITACPMFSPPVLDVCLSDLGPDILIMNSMIYLNIYTNSGVAEKSSYISSNCYLVKRLS